VSITFKTTAKLSEANFTFDSEFASTGAQKLDTIDLSQRRFEGTSITMAVEQAQGGDGPRRYSAARRFASGSAEGDAAG
jgi:hypothetical protein